MFPGAAQLFIQNPPRGQTDRAPPAIVNDISVLDISQNDTYELNLSDSAFMDFTKEDFQNNLSEIRAMLTPQPGAHAPQKPLTHRMEAKPQLRGDSDNKENEYAAEAGGPCEILGFISHEKELFLFEQRVKHSDKIECWLQGVEANMQETVGKLINYAVSTFPKQSLDEWILDYPQQIILTTIHLILTHEINELFEEFRKGDGNKDGHGQDKHGDSSHGPNSQYSDDDMTPRTPDTRDLIRHSQASLRPDKTSSHVSQKSALSKLIQQKKMADQKSSSGTTAQNAGLKTNKFSLGGKSEESVGDSDIEEEMSRERRKFMANMFGADFDIGAVTEDREETMRILQEKSFRGLYLRLQFWINQICKSLYGKTQSIALHPVHKLVMKSIVSFLSYMRDVVFELKSRKIENCEDYEWQKQMRLTWNGRDSGCKVDCGAWTTYQGNEYLGSIIRPCLTPLSTKYFVFISAAFREKSAVLFKCIPSHDYCGDIFGEFSNICTVPFKSYHCHPRLSMKSLMQYLNGAALASVWIFFEHIDQLDFVHLQTFNKEIQMVQQQFIIAELSQDSSVITAHITVGSHSQSQAQRSIERRNHQPDRNRPNQDSKEEDHIGHEDDSEEGKDLDDEDDSLLENLEAEGGDEASEDYDGLLADQSQADDVSAARKEDKTNGSIGGQSKMHKICFGVFASISHGFMLARPGHADEIASTLQSAFRVISLTKPEMLLLMRVLMKCEGFREYDELSTRIRQFMHRFEKGLGMTPGDLPFNQRDLRMLIKVATVYLQKRQAPTTEDAEEEDDLRSMERRRTEVTCIRDALAVFCRSRYARDIHGSQVNVDEVVAEVFAERPEESEDRDLVRNVEEAYENLKLVPKKEQMSNAVRLLKAFRSSKGIAIIGPKCSGKTVL